MTVRGESGASFHALRFGRAAARYEGSARVQARMAETLIGLWGDRPAPGAILEFGCGTGLLTRMLGARFPRVPLLATDAAPEMIEVARAAPPGNGTDVTFQVLNARGDTPPERLPQGASPDLIASNALVQWFPDLATHFRFAASIADPAARYLVSGFDRANFPELNALLAEPPFAYREFPGHSSGEITKAAEAAGWQVSAFLGWEEVEMLPSARDVLNKLQDLGSVRDPRIGGRLTRASLAWLLEEYARRFPAEGGVRLTWKPWAALLSRS